MTVKRYDDGFRGPGVIDARSLSECWLDLIGLDLAWPENRDLKERITSVLYRVYPPDQLDRAVAEELKKEAVLSSLIAAVECGRLPLWVAPIDSPECLVDPKALLELQKETVISGIYRPPNDRGWLAGRPLFVKRADWDKFLRSLTSLQPKKTAAGEHDCKAWLTRLFEAGEPGVREDFKARALVDIPGVSGRSFDRVWSEVAPNFGRDKGGRPKNPRT